MKEGIGGRKGGKESRGREGGVHVGRKIRKVAGEDEGEKEGQRERREVMKKKKLGAY